PVEDDVVTARWCGQHEALLRRPQRCTVAEQHVRDTERLLPGRGELARRRKSQLHRRRQGATGRSESVEYAVARSLQETVRVEKERRLESPGRRRELRVFVPGGDCAQRFVNQRLARLQVIAAESLVGPEAE